MYFGLGSWIQIRSLARWNFEIFGLENLKTWEFSILKPEHAVIFDYILVGLGIDCKSEYFQLSVTHGSPKIIHHTHTPNNLENKWIAVSLWKHWSGPWNIYDFHQNWTKGKQQPNTEEKELRKGLVIFRESIFMPFQHSIEDLH
jgi:hypothetical protein